jgi:GDP-L-fucose synthase
MEKSSKIYVAGHTGLVGSAIMRNLIGKGYTNLIFRTQQELNLTDQQAVHKFFEAESPEYVFLAAALVGGIVANNKYRADFIYQNIMIQSNVIHAAWQYGVKKLLFLGSTCIYPKEAPQPLKEEYLLTSPLEYTNEPYAIAKIAGLKLCESFNIQYNTDFIAVMPTNLYGPGDNYDLEKSHVLPALMRKIHLGKCLEENNWQAIRKDFDKNPVDGLNGEAEEERILATLEKYGVFRNDKVTINVWGTGNPLREFMYSEDMAEACTFLLENVSIRHIIELDGQSHLPLQAKPHFLNLGTGEEVAIKDLALKLKNLLGFKGKIDFDSSKPDGTMRKTTDTSLLKSLGYIHKYDLNSGLVATYEQYLNSQS